MTVSSPFPKASLSMETRIRFGHALLPGPANWLLVRTLLPDEGQFRRELYVKHGDFLAVGLGTARQEVAGRWQAPLPAHRINARAGYDGALARPVRTGEHATHPRCTGSAWKKPTLVNCRSALSQPTLRPLRLESDHPNAFQLFPPQDYDHDALLRGSQSGSLHCP
jgi:hypothetical protein